MNCYQVILEIIPFKSEDSQESRCVLRFQNGLAIYFDSPEEAVSYLRGKSEQFSRKAKEKD